MAGWESVLAAVGGLLLGFGAGLVVSRRREAQVRRKLTRHGQRLRSTVIPVLEERAGALGLSPAERATTSEDPLELTIELSDAIQRFSDARTLPFSDTLDAARAVSEEP